jgi:hypothetical protein
MIILHIVIMKSLVHIFFILKTSMTKDRMMQTSSCHWYDYKMTIA